MTKDEKDAMARAMGLRAHAVRMPEREGGMLVMHTVRPADFRAAQIRDAEIRKFGLTEDEDDNAKSKLVQRYDFTPKEIDWVRDPETTAKEVERYVRATGKKIKSTGLPEAEGDDLPRYPDNARAGAHSARLLEGDDREELDLGMGVPRAGRQERQHAAGFTLRTEKPSDTRAREAVALHLGRTTAIGR